MHRLRLERCRSPLIADILEKEAPGENSKKAICLTLRPDHG